jgi:formylglycine-generating enzyme required for sulfatase activity
MRNLNKAMKRVIIYGIVGIGITLLTSSCKSTQKTTEGKSATEKLPSESIASNQKKVTGYAETIASTEVMFEMIDIPGGSFLMGSPENEADRKADEGAQREVSVDDFYMAKYETTWDVFELFFKQNRELFVKLDNDKVIKIDAITRPSPPYEDPSYGMGKEDFPAVSMSAYSALVFCKWLSTVTGKFYRLPTEAEWEYAARAGSTTAYSFGDVTNIDNYAVYYKNANGVYAKVGTKKPNAWGLYDMHGNAAEWTLDEYKADAYATLESKNPWMTPMVIHPRVYRGGSWDDDAKALRSAARTASSKKLQKRDPQIPKSFWWFTDSNFVGFRLVSPKVQPTADEQKKFWQRVLDE